MKYNKKGIMKRAWEMKKSWSCRTLTFAECLKKSWAEAKDYVKTALYNGIKFVNRMVISVGGYDRVLTRWTKGGHDRVYINCQGSKNSDGYVDIKTGYVKLYSDCMHISKMAELILTMEF